MAKTDFQNIDEYHNTFEGEALARLNTVRDIIHNIAPEASEVISYQIPAFKIGPKAFLIYYCAFAKHISISNPWSPALLNEFETELKNYKISKSVIQFPHDQELPIDLISRIIKFRKKEITEK
jgi:uncharacterized protein YdhG (YjbR/CyaY superfamily)